MRTSVAVLFGLVLAFDAAIYGTRILEPYRTANWAYAKGKDGTAYAIRLWKDGESRTFELTMDEKIPTVPTKVVHLSSGREVAVRTESDGRLTLVLPKDVKLDEYADAFRLVAGEHKLLSKCDERTEWRINNI